MTAPESMVAADSELDMAPALKAVCQVATNALEVVPTFLEQLTGASGAGGIPLAMYK